MVRSEVATAKDLLQSHRIPAKSKETVSRVTQEEDDDAWVGHMKAQRGKGQHASKKPKKKGPKKRKHQSPVTKPDQEGVEPEEALEASLAAHHLSDEEDSEAFGDVEEAPDAPPQGTGTATGKGERDEDEEECAVCFFALYSEDTDEKEAATVRLMCSHVFHDRCLDLWASQCQTKHLSVTCPMCRGSLMRA
jgi:hypothetical protein